MTSTPAHPAPTAFNWPLAYEAEAWCRRRIEAFLARNAAARRLAADMAARTGTDFYEWVDHFTAEPGDAAELATLGLQPESVPAPDGRSIWHHPRAMMPRIALVPGGTHAGAPLRLAIRPESVAEFSACHGLRGPIFGAEGARLRRVIVATENEHEFNAVERLAFRGFKVEEPPPGMAEALRQTRVLWQARREELGDDEAAGIRRAFEIQGEAIRLVGRDAAGELFFAAERRFWESRNAAGRLQKARQDRLGLGWGNHDHHTFRCSRPHFADLIRFLLYFGFEKRERYYAGAEAGWGAQISEHAATGITVFADVDLLPEETEIDFSMQPLRAASRLGTVGLWCGLHGDSFLQAGMPHLGARFDFAALRTQLESNGVKTMKPFSDFAFLKQAFTVGERWKVAPARVERLRSEGLITAEQAEGFLRDGAIGSHLENLERKGGYKGFNQKSVSAIISATDPRTIGLSHA